MFNMDILMTALSGVTCLICILQGQKSTSAFMWVGMLVGAVLNGYNFFYWLSKLFKGA